MNTKKTLSLLFAPSVAVIALLSAVTARAQSFSYSDFSAASLAANPLQLNGSATAPVFNGTTDVLRLTPALDNQAGSAFSKTAVSLGNNASFSTAFSFQLTSGGGISDGTSNPPGADGLVFVLNTVANNVGSLGQGVGYQGVAHSVGVKFDTWDDSTAGGFPQDNDPNGNFVEVYTDGSTLTTPSSTFYTPPTSMKNGDIWYAWVDYNGASDQLSVSLSDGVNARPSAPQIVETLDLNDPDILGSSPDVFAGFTSGTGGAFDNTDVLQWGFNDTFQPITTVGNDVPDSGATLTMVAGALFALVAIRRRLARA